MARRFGLAVLFLLAASVAGGQDPLPALSGWGKMRPVDEAVRNPSLRAFRDTLIAIVARRDSAALSRNISPAVIFNFGVSRGGADAFFTQWSPSMDLLWKALDDVLRHGGRLDTARMSFQAPWTSAATPIDVEEAMIVRDSNVVVRERPDSLARPLGTLSFDVVYRAAGVWDDSWTTIRLRDGRTGYVASRSIRSPMQWRISIDRVGNRWMLGLLLAGD
jgi:hypothetical protein